MKPKQLIVLFIIALLMIESSCQRGGGRSLSRKRRSRSSFPLFGSRRSHKNTTCIIQFLIQRFFIKNSTLQSSYDLQKDQNSQKPILSSMTVMIFGLCLIFMCIYACRNGQFRFRINKQHEINRILNQFKRDNQCWGNLNQSQVNQTMKWFVQTKWKVQKRVGFNAKIQSWQLRLNKLIKQQDYIYEIKAEGYNDAQGSFSLKGILLLRNRSIHICFVKQITNKTPNIKKGKLGFLIYRAHSDQGKIQGKWNYDGLRYDPRYSGVMKIVPQ